MASITTRAATTKRKVSKNKKKNWRKHSDIKDVEEFLEEQRLQLRTGGLVEDKPDESLFFEDKKQSTDDEGPLRKRQKSLRPIYPYLEPDPNINAFPKPTAYKPNKSSRTKKVKALNELEKLGIFTPGRLNKLETALRQSARHQKKRDQEKAAKESGRAQFDMWGDADPISKAYGVKKGDEASEHFLRVTKKVPRKLPTKYFAKPTKVPAVEVEAAGASYNPSFEDHQAHIQSTYEVEAGKQKKEDKLDRWHAQVKKLPAKVLEKAYMEEMSSELFGKDTGEVGTPQDEEEEDVTPNPPVVADRKKTKKQRRKEREEKTRGYKLKHEKRNKIRLNEVYRLRGIKRELKKAEEDTETKTQENIDKKALLEGLPRQVGRHKVEDPDLAIKLSDELVGTLRELKPEGDLLTERYKHFQKRNLIEARTSVKGVKRKFKEYTRKSHKETAEEEALPFRNKRGYTRKVLK